eukprot:TRINITY_DN3792_c0_g2_i1.p2 TRINITY_DN3792_c0_g2~~TRINITY_DN3792_c0_g2_i1.p2  ORF type:complete len:217 (-),score=-25.05 TRINITY_DN3792_c0_g2_i1:1868-2518(-)
MDQFILSNVNQTVNHSLVYISIYQIRDELKTKQINMLIQLVVVNQVLNFCLWACCNQTKYLKFTSATCFTSTLLLQFCVIFVSLDHQTKITVFPLQQQRSYAKNKNVLQIRSYAKNKNNIILIIIRIIINQGRKIILENELDILLSTLSFLSLSTPLPFKKTCFRFILQNLFFFKCKKEARVQLEHVKKLLHESIIHTDDFKICKIAIFCTKGVTK